MAAVFFRNANTHEACGKHIAIIFNRKCGVSVVLGSTGRNFLLANFPSNCRKISLLISEAPGLSGKHRRIGFTAHCGHCLSVICLAMAIYEV